MTGATSSCSSLSLLEGRMHVHAKQCFTFRVGFFISLCTLNSAAEIRKRSGGPTSSCWSSCVQASPLQVSRPSDTPALQQLKTFTRNFPRVYLIAVSASLSYVPHQRQASKLHIGVDGMGATALSCTQGRTTIHKQFLFRRDICRFRNAN